ncbi:hypothetical protein [Christiangramia sabulilitoris]|uniref:Uncharacterized protein n=1 Tax=Christiangramia sabulilitoris TaxID=2583991 RepID=A0A550I0N4_9FLAO|nr:hypothetical protein [Christiangramia sabulilitoris]TRO64531.1 hypothetical protein FGM01_13675 [Christiangramia sabulilitoris]
MSENNLEEKSAGSMNNDQGKPELPRLYSKTLILVFSGVFSILFGAALLLSNLKRQEEKKGMMQVAIFVLIYVIGIVYTLQSMKSGANLTLPLNLVGALFLNEYFWNRYIGSETAYEKKSWVKPALISLAISIPAFLALLYLG